VSTPAYRRGGFEILTARGGAGKWSTTTPKTGNTVHSKLKTHNATQTNYTHEMFQIMGSLEACGNGCGLLAALFGCLGFGCFGAPLKCKGTN